MYLRASLRSTCKSEENNILSISNGLAYTINSWTDSYDYKGNKVKVEGYIAKLEEVIEVSISIEKIYNYLSPEVKKHKKEYRDIIDLRDYFSTLLIQKNIPQEIKFEESFLKNMMEKSITIYKQVLIKDWKERINACN
jgi:hypothetical protein